MKLSVNRKINFYDCDPAGIMFFANAFNLIHSAYEELIAQMDIPDYWTTDEYIVPITKAETSYYLPLKAGDEIVIEVEVSQLRDHSFELSYTGRDKEGKKLFFSKTVHIFTSRDFQKIKIPVSITAKLTYYLSA